jgi:hypothetical protein
MIHHITRDAFHLALLPKNNALSAKNEKSEAWLHSYISDYCVPFFIVIVPFQ